MVEAQRLNWVYSIIIEMKHSKWDILTNGSWTLMDDDPPLPI